MLKGLGTVAIGLPFMEEMLVSTATAAAKPTIPVRAFNVFFGLGIPAPLQGRDRPAVLVLYLPHYPRPPPVGNAQG